MGTCWSRTSQKRKRQTDNFSNEETTSMLQESSVSQQVVVENNGTTLEPILTELARPFKKETSAEIVSKILATTQINPIGPRLTENIKDDKEALEVFAKMLSHQGRKSTTTHYNRFWERWTTFAQRKQYPLLPSKEGSQEEFEAGYAHFAAVEYDIAGRGGRNGDSLPNKPNTYSDIFTGINHVVEKILLQPALHVQMVENLIRSYAAEFPSQDTKKAPPVEPKHLVRLVKVAKGLKQDWFTFVVEVALIMWMSASRWSDIDNLDVQESMKNNDNPDVWLLHMRKRKNSAGPTWTETPVLDNEFDARAAFQNICHRYGRKHSWNLLPKFKKTRSTWTVVEDPHQKLTYDTFLKMFRAAMKIARLEKSCNFGQPGTVIRDDWTMHGFRSGFTSAMRGDGKVNSITIEALARHGGWSYESVATILGYNCVTAAQHVKLIQPAILRAFDQSPTLQPTQQTEQGSTPVRKSKRQRMNRRR